MKLKRIGIWSAARIQAILMAFFGLILGLFYALYNQFVGPLPTSTGAQSMGWMAIIVVPIFYGIIGLVIGVVGALAYNLLARWIGGIEIELSK